MADLLCFLPHPLNIALQKALLTAVCAGNRRAPVVGVCPRIGAQVGQVGCVLTACDPQRPRMGQQ